jgi:hypothetical protein
MTPETLFAFLILVQFIVIDRIGSIVDGRFREVARGMCRIRVSGTPTYARFTWMGYVRNGGDEAPFADF